MDEKSRVYDRVVSSNANDSVCDIVCDVYEFLFI